MGWRYRKRIKIAPGVYINLSKSGVSTTIGPRGANVNIGKNGTYLNTGIPGTGLYNRQKIGGANHRNDIGNYSNTNDNTSNAGCNGCAKLGCGFYLLAGILGCVINIIEGKEKGSDLLYTVLLLTVLSLVFYVFFLRKGRIKHSVLQKIESFYYRMKRIILGFFSKKNDLILEGVIEEHVNYKVIDKSLKESSDAAENSLQGTTTSVEDTAGLNDSHSDKEQKKEEVESLLITSSKCNENIDEEYHKPTMYQLFGEDLKTPINPKEPFINYRYPNLELLKKYSNNSNNITVEDLLAKKKRIIEILNSFGIKIKEITAVVGPAITFYEIVLAEDVRISKIRNLEDDIAFSFSVEGARIIAPIPGKGTIGIEVPNVNTSIVSMESIINSKKFQETTMRLPLALGKTITNEVFMVDLVKIPHLLLVGAPDQGKSMCLDVIISSLLYRKHPNELKFVLVDPRKVEFSLYNPIANAFMVQVPEVDDEPVITDTNKVLCTLKGIRALMDHRYDLLAKAGVRNVNDYNNKFINHQLRLTDEDGNPLHDYMPYIVVMIDDFGDLLLTLGKELEDYVAHIVQFARVVGIHMIIAVQRPNRKIINDNIKMLFPARIAFRVGSTKDSCTIIGCPDASRLLGNGDMLYINGNEPVRVQCACIDTQEVESIAQHIHSQELAGLTPQYPMQLPESIEDNGDIVGGLLDTSNWDPLFEQSAHAVVSTQQGSTAMIQRQFSIGYNRAGRIMDQLEKAGIVGAAHGSKPREVLYADEMALDNHIANLRGKR